MRNKSAAPPSRVHETSRTTEPPPEGLEGPLTPISRALGVEGKVFETPAIFGVPSQRIPLVLLIIVAGIGLILGPRFAAGFVLVYMVYKSNQQ